MGFFVLCTGGIEPNMHAMPYQKEAPLQGACRPGSALVCDDAHVIPIIHVAAGAMETVGHWVPGPLPCLALSNTQLERGHGRGPGRGPASFRLAAAAELESKRAWRLPLCREPVTDQTSTPARTGTNGEGAEREWE